jgi:hypothetical protein
MQLECRGEQDTIEITIAAKTKTDKNLSPFLFDLNAALFMTICFIYELHNSVKSI